MVHREKEFGRFCKFMNAIFEKYVSLATAHGDATENGNSDQANIAYRKLDELFEEIKHKGLRGELSQLLTHANPSVRSEAAFHTYVLDPCRSESVLEEVSTVPGLIGFSAGMTLRQIRNGELKPL